MATVCCVVTIVGNCLVVAVVRSIIVSPLLPSFVPWMLCPIAFSGCFLFRYEIFVTRYAIWRSWGLWLVLWVSDWAYHYVHSFHPVLILCSQAITPLRSHSQGIAHYRAPVASYTPSRFYGLSLPRSVHVGLRSLLPLFLGQQSLIIKFMAFGFLFLFFLFLFSFFFGLGC